MTRTLLLLMLFFLPAQSYAQSVNCPKPPNWVGTWPSYQTTGNPGDIRTSTEVGNTIGQAVKSDGGAAVNLTACNPVLKDGSATGTDIGNATQNMQGTTRALNGKLRDVISVRDFGARGDGSNDDLPAINAAIAYAKSTANYGGIVYFPDGVYNISDTIRFSGSGVQLVGSNSRSATIRATFTAGNIIEIVDSGSAMNDGVFSMNIEGQSQMTSGGAIYVDNVYNFHAENLRIFKNTFDGIVIENSNRGTYGVFLNRLYLSVYDKGILLGDKSADDAHVPTDVFLSEAMILPSQPYALCGICLEAAGGFYAAGVDITNQGENYFSNSLRISPGSSTNVNAVLLSRVLADSATNENIAFSGAGPISDVTITNGWANTSKTGSGILFSNPMTDGVTISASVVDSNAQNGIVINSGKNIAIQSSRILSNSMSKSGSYDGVVVAQGTSHFVVTNNQIGDGGYFNSRNPAGWHQRYGLIITSAASDDYIATGNRGFGNTKGIISDNGTGSNKSVSGNVGG